LKPEEIAAYIGAAAWLPQILVWIYRATVYPRLRVVPDQRAEVGFTNFGPIFNVRMAFFVENRDLIIDGIDLIFRHEGGEERIFRWAGLGETFSEITDAAGNKQIVSKDQTPIAIKVATQSLLEKFVRFQEPRFHAADGLTTKALVSHFNFLKQKSPDAFVQPVLESKEYFSVVEQRKKWFCWKPGRYELTLKPSSPQKFKLVGSTFAFELQEVDVDLLRRNVPLVDTEIKNIIMSNVPDTKPDQLTWQWANVTMHRNNDA
jgi:hypothetical protein